MKISVIIVAHNSRAYIGRCLDSVLAQKYEDSRIILVDNGSFDGTADLVEARYPQVLVIRNPYNAGPARARNQGIDKSCGEWVLTLDADAYLREDFFSSFSYFLEKSGKDDSLGIVVPRILGPDEKTNYALGHQLTLLRRFYDVGRGRGDHRSMCRIKEVFGACAATAFYRRKMLDDLKNRSDSCFDESFFFMAEDVDLAWRARRLGWKVSVCHDCVSFHKGNGSGTSRRLKDFYSIRNRFLMMMKNDSVLRLTLFFLPLALYEILRFLHRFLRQEAGLYASAVASAFRLAKSKAKIFFAVVGLGCFLAEPCALCLQEYKNEDEEARAYNVTRTVKTVEGLHFFVQEDRPIEKIAGVYRPIDIDSYVALKFNKLDTKFNDLISDLQEKIEDLSKKIDALARKIEELTASKTAPPANEAAATNP